MKYKEAELTINKILLDTLGDVSKSEIFFADMNTKDVAKVHRAIDKATRRINKLQSTLVKQLFKDGGFDALSTPSE